jgi:hypothetical protein
MSRLKIQDHSVYKGQTDKQIVERITKIQKLLAHFDVKAYAFDPGVRCYTIEPFLNYTTCSLNFGHNEWKWLEPLLIELIHYRREYGVPKKKS